MREKQEEAPFICLVGNDGTGKSTMCRLVNERTQYRGVERSMKESEDENVRKLVKEIRMIDKLTYSYAFEDDWYNFDISHSLHINGKQVPVHWVVLAAPCEVLDKRIQKRPDITIYEHQKCIKYFNVVYQEMAYFYGMNLVNADQPIDQVLADIQKTVANSHHCLPIRSLTISCLHDHELEHKIAEQLTQGQGDGVYDQKILKELETNQMSKFYFPALYDYCDDKMKKSMVARWIKNNALRQFKDSTLILTFKWGIEEQREHSINIKLQKGYLFEAIIQGQSKILYKVLTNSSTLQAQFENKVIIVLKSTIYSHTKQRTCQISQLGKIRAKGSMLFLEMLKRNNIKHSYICINKEGIILSHLVEVNALEIVFKKEWLGTDKYSYMGMQKCRQICDANNCYAGGIYVRFDWRNPNHIFTVAPSITLNEDPYYYLVEKNVGKQKFFSKFLAQDKCKPIGDKCVTEDLINNYADVKEIKQKVVQAYCTFQYYAHEVGLEVLDGCMMIDKDCQYIWSEINPDCLRVKSIKQREDYDKDIWRIGGSASKDLIMKKWQIFNDIFVEYFKNNRFMDSEVVHQLLCKQIYAKQLLNEGNLRPGYRHLYHQVYRGKKQREVIGTIDIINGEPILVQSSVFKQKHSDASIQQALTYISIMPQILLVDIDAASDKPQNNRALIGTIAKSHPLLNLYAVGGGIRSIEIANEYLSLFHHIVISSNLELINEIPKEKRKRIIVELSINESNQVLTHARTVNTGINVVKKMMELCEIGIQCVSITFNGSQGKLNGLPREQLRKLMYQIPGPIKKVIIAGGITSIEDVQFLWGFPKCVPQMGSAIWKRKIKIGEIYSRMVRYDQNDLIPTIVQDQQGKNLGLIYLNEEALIKTCEDRHLYRYSRQHKKLMKKGEESGNTQKILSINIDCDNDSLLITVDNEHPIFCHKQAESCFFEDISKGTKMNLRQLQKHIGKTKNGGGSGYSHQMQNNPKLAISKVMEEVEELSYAENNQRRVEECADVMAHLMMYMNSEGISIDQVTGLLNQRSKVEKKPHQKSEKEANMIRIGLAAGKHTKLILQFVEKVMGVKILPHIAGKQRNYALKYEIIDEQKFYKSIKAESKDCQVSFVSMKPKDLSKLMYKNYVQLGINYSNVVENSCDRHQIIAETPVEGLRLALIKRKGEKVNIESWSEQNKGTIVSEYPTNVVNYFKEKNIPSNYYKLIKVSGHSEGFLSDLKFDYCDAIVYSGKTIQDNNLEIEAIIKKQIKIILFSFPK